MNFDRFTIENLIELQKANAKLDNTDVKKKDAEFIATVKAEQQILVEKTLGITKDLLQLRPFLYQVDKVEVQKLAKQRFYDPNFLNTLQLYFDVFVIPNPSPVLAQTPSARLFREWLTNLKPLAEGKDGVTFRSNLGDIQDLFVIKAPHQILDYGAVHEQFVAMVYTNHLRALCPNFAYVYGSFLCSLPLADKQFSEVSGFCYHNIYEQSSNHLIYENIKGSSVTDWLRTNLKAQTLRKGQIFNLMLQVMLSLELANAGLIEGLEGFQHADANPGNIVMRELDQNAYIYWPQRQYYLRVKRVATWIDFNRAHIKYKGRHYKRHRARIQGDGPEVFPLVDVFRIMVYMTHTIFYHATLARKSKDHKGLEYYQKLLQFCEPWYYWFFQNQDPPTKWSKVVAREMVRPVLTYNESWLKFKVSHILDFTLQQQVYQPYLMQTWTRNAPERVLACAVDKDNCSSLNDYLVTTVYKAGQTWPHPRTLLELADQAGIGKTFNPDYQAPPWQQEWERISYKQILDWNSKLDKLNKQVFLVNDSTYANEVSLASFVDYEQRMLNYTQYWLNIRQLIVIPLLLWYYYYPEMQESMNIYLTNYMAFRELQAKHLEQIIESVQQNIVAVSNIISSDAYAQLIQSSPQYQAYDRGIKILKHTVLPTLTNNPEVPEINTIAGSLGWSS